MTGRTEFEQVTGMTVHKAQGIHEKMSAEAWSTLNHSEAAVAAGDYEEARVLLNVSGVLFLEQENPPHK